MKRAGTYRGLQQKKEAKLILTSFDLHVAETAVNANRLLKFSKGFAFPSPIDL